MKTGMTRLGRRSPGRTLAVPTVPYRRLAARGGRPGALARVGGAGPYIIELILADRERIRRLLRKDDDVAGYGGDPGCPEAPTLGVPMRPQPVGTHVAPELGMRALFAIPGLRRCPDGSTDRTWPSRIRAAVAVRSAGRIPGSSSLGHRADQRPARSSQARGADPDTGAYAVGQRRVVADVAAAVLARRIRFDEETTGSGRRSCENCGRRTTERHSNGSGAASRGDLRAAGGHPDR
jgi:hypothetical protein